MEAALEKARSIAGQNKIAIILPMDLYRDDTVYNAAAVVNADGKLLGYQTKTNSIHRKTWSGARVPNGSCLR